MTTTAPPPAATTDPPGQPGRWWVWPAIVVGLLLMNVTMCFTAVYLSQLDRSHAILPDYYQRAVDWDRSAAARRASAALGWTAAFSFGDAVSILGERAVTLHLTDRDGRPVDDADVRLHYFHHARGAERFDGRLNRLSPGVYIASLPMRRAGLWEFEIVAARGDQTFLDTQQQRIDSKG